MTHFMFMLCHKVQLQLQSWGSWMLRGLKVFVSCAVLIKNRLSAFLTTAVVRQLFSEVSEFLNPETECLNSTNCARFLVCICSLRRAGTHCSLPTYDIRYHKSVINTSLWLQASKEETVFPDRQRADMKISSCSGASHSVKPLTHSLTH